MSLQLPVFHCLKISTVSQVCSISQHWVSQYLFKIEIVHQSTHNESKKYSCVCRANLLIRAKYLTANKCSVYASNESPTVSDGDGCSILLDLRQLLLCQYFKIICSLSLRYSFEYWVETLIYLETYLHHKSVWLVRFVMNSAAPCCDEWLSGPCQCNTAYPWCHCNAVCVALFRWVKFDPLGHTLFTGIANTSLVVAADDRLWVPSVIHACYSLTLWHQKSHGYRKHPMPDWVKPSFVIFDIRAL